MNHPYVSTSLADLSARCVTRFERRFNRPPRWLVAAPGRVNLIGEHIDYNDGFVLPMAIERHVVIAADVNDAEHIQLVSAAQGDEARIALNEPVTRGQPEWADYCRGVIAGYMQRGVTNAGATLPGVDAVIDADVPIGGGLSSSAALEVATATMIESVTGRALEPVDRALLCQRAEHEFAGVPCGIMDPFASVLCRADHLLLLDCRSQAFEHVPMSGDDVTVLIIDTQVRHELTDGGYAARRAQCEEVAAILGMASLRDATMEQVRAARDALGDVRFRRARHVVTEIARTVEAAERFRRGDWSSMGRLMAESHASLRGDYEVSCDELDAIVESAGRLGPSVGVIGCRMTGGGFGGCAVCLVKRDAVDAVTERILADYRAAFGIDAAAFATRPAAGARVLQHPGRAGNT